MNPIPAVPNELDTYSGLYIVATPIGNLGDMSSRAWSILQHANGILAEDTRRTQQLLRHAGITTPVVRFDAHREHANTPSYIARLLAGESWALVSDAGTPTVRDPGAHLVEQAHRAGVRVCPVPGPCAWVSALSVSGLKADPCLFLGFLPAKKAERQATLRRYQCETATLVVYESPHRLHHLLEDMQDVWGAHREVVLCRELTKKFETVHRTTLADLWRQSCAQKGAWKGEIVLVIQGAEPTGVSLSAQATQLADLWSIVSDHVSEKTAVYLLARITGLPKNQVYQWVLSQPPGESDD